MQTIEPCTKTVHNDQKKAPELSKSATVSPADKKGLPEELLKQIKPTSGMDATIVSALQYVGGSATIDKVLISIYHQTGEIMERRLVARKMYKMKDKGKLAVAVSGVYSLPPSAESEVKP